MQEVPPGVGPWPGSWPTEPFYDPELLELGDARNVVDRYRYWRLEAIVADLDTHRHPFHVAIENWQHDLNIGAVVRNANAFLAAEVHIVGARQVVDGEHRKLPIPRPLVQRGRVGVVAHVLVAVGDHRAAAVPLPVTDDVHLGGQERVRGPDDLSLIHI